MSASTKRRVMRKLEISEISACDRPAQAGAVAVFMKRAEDEPARVPAKLKSIKLDELSLVDRPANPHARVILFKRHEQENDMDVQKIGDDRIASFDSFDQAVDHLRKVHGMRGSDAMSAAANQHPDLLARYQQAGDAIAKAAQDAGKPQPLSKAVMAFDDRVGEIQKSRGVPRSVAMRAARQRYPAEFAAAYGKDA